MIKPKYLVEYVLVRMLAFVIQHLPYRAGLVLGWGVAWLAFYVVGFRVRKAEARIREVFGTRFSSRQVRRIAWMSWRNFVFSVVDLVRVPVSTQEWIRTVIDYEGAVEKILSHLRNTGQGAIVAVPHMGAWEMSALVAASYGIPLFSVAARQKNRLVDEFMNRMRKGTGLETVIRDSSVLRGIIRRIREGKVLAILPDVRSPTEALPIHFLGKTANLASGMGFFARHTGVPVFPTVITRVGWARHRCRTFDPVWPDPGMDKQADALRITQAVLDVFERRIRAEPEQWFWFNKRWILDPFEVMSVPDEPLSQSAAEDTNLGEP